MLGIGAIEILEATYNLGMCGHIVVQINKTGKRYQVCHSMTDGWQVSERIMGEWSEAKRMSPEEFIQLLPEDRGWTCGSFIAAWAGFASGYQSGVTDGRNERCPECLENLKEIPSAELDT
jgi:hypothetical protein